MEANRVKYSSCLGIVSRGLRVEVSMRYIEHTRDSRYTSRASVFILYKHTIEVFMLSINHLDLFLFSLTSYIKSEPFAEGTKLFLVFLLALFLLATMIKIHLLTLG